MRELVSTVVSAEAGAARSPDETHYTIGTAAEYLAQRQTSRSGASTGAGHTFTVQAGKRARPADPAMLVVRSVTSVCIEPAYRGELVRVLRLRFTLVREWDAPSSRPRFRTADASSRAC